MYKRLDRKIIALVCVAAFFAVVVAGSVTGGLFLGKASSVQSSGQIAGPAILASDDEETTFIESLLGLTFAQMYAQGLDDEQIEQRYHMAQMARSTPTINHSWNATTFFDPRETTLINAVKTRAAGGSAIAGGNAYFIGIHGNSTGTARFGGHMSALWQETLRTNPSLQANIQSGRINSIGLISCSTGKLDWSAAAAQKLANASGLPVITHHGGVQSAGGTSWKSSSGAQMPRDLEQAIRSGIAKVYMPDPSNTNPDGTTIANKPANLLPPNADLNQAFGNPGAKGFNMGDHGSGNGPVVDNRFLPGKIITNPDGTRYGTLFDTGVDPTEGYKGI